MRSGRARAVLLRGEAERRTEGEALLQKPGDAVLIRRGPLRSMLLRCPDGCGETLVVNLDPRAGKAWRLRLRGGPTLYPSVWRDGGCESHFIVWSGRILWCGPEDEGDQEPAYDRRLEDRLLASLGTDRLRSAEDLGAELDESEWDILRAGRKLIARGAARSGKGSQRNWFALA